VTSDDLASSPPDPQPSAAAGRRRAIVCCTPFGEDWRWFLEGLTAPDVRWRFFSDKPTHRWQQWFQRPNLVTPIATLRTILAVRRERARLLITLDPRLSFWCALWCRLLRVQVEHLVFSFNFAELPRGWRVRLFRFAYAQLAAVRVHSTMEKELYCRYFGIAPERVTVALWAINKPEIEPAEPLLDGEYVCALGSNARDYATLAAAAAQMPQVPMVWVARPENVRGLKLPAQVKVVGGIPYKAAMNYLAYSRFMVLPLQGAEVPCGHVTLVSAMYLDKAIVATDSAGIADYVVEGETGLLARPGDADSMREKILELWNDRERAVCLGSAGRAYVEAHCSDAFVAAEMTARFKALGLA
jgi:glycosyltransferase involved in cell wall biosynthesis